MVKTVNSDVSSAPTIRSAAVNFAKIANADEKLAGIIATGLDAAEDVKRAPLQVMVRMIADFGDKLNDFPVPGSKEGNNPDKYTAQVQNDKKEWVKKPGSFYKDFFTATTEGADIASMLAAIEVANKDPDNAPEELKGMSSLEVQQARKQFQQRQAGGIKLYEKGVGIHLQLKAFNDAFGKDFTFGYSRGTDKVEPSNSTLPMYVIQKDDGTKTKAFSISAFLALNVEKAKAKGGDFAAIIGSGGRQGDSGTGDDGEDRTGFTKSSIEDGVADMATFVDEIDNVQVLYGLLKAKDKDGQPVSDDLLLSMEKVALEFTSIISKKEQADRLKFLHEQERKAA